MVRSTACLDWAERLQDGRSIIPPPIFPDQAAQIRPAPVLVPLAGELSDVAGAKGGREAHAALANLS